MRRTLVAAVAISIVYLLTRVGAQLPPIPERGTLESLPGWTVERAAPGRLVVADGILKVTEEAGWVRTAAAFGDFALHFQALPLSMDTRALVVVRGHAPAGAAPGTGFGVTIGGDAPPATPDMFLQKPSFGADQLAKVLNPRTEWQEYDIVCEGDVVTVTINGFVIFSERRVMDAEGWIGIRNEGGSLALRSLRSQSVQQASPPAGFKRIDVTADGTAVQQDEPLTSWLAEFTGELVRRWVPPPDANALQGRVEAVLSIEKNGKIGDVVLKASPHDALNQTAREAIAESRPKSLPARHPNSQAQLTVTFLSNQYPEHPAPIHATGVYRSGNGVVAPRILASAEPAYTANAMKARVQGTIVMELAVAADGTVGDVRIIRPLDATYGLDDEAIKAARRMRFAPGLRLGQPVPVVATVEMEFRTE